MTIGDKIKKLRKQNHMTQEELSEKLHISRQTISKWETGSALPDINNVILICSIFEISTDELLTDSLNQKNNKKLFICDLVVLTICLIGTIVFSVLLITNKVNADSSTITINAYGILTIIFLILLISIVILLIIKHVKKRKN